jgi:hypothetical protein
LNSAIDIGHNSFPGAADKQHRFVAKYLLKKQRAVLKTCAVYQRVSDSAMRSVHADFGASIVCQPASFSFGSKTQTPTHIRL